jgi:hypothetical protein
VDFWTDTREFRTSGWGKSRTPYGPAQFSNTKHATRHTILFLKLSLLPTAILSYSEFVLNHSVFKLRVSWRGICSRSDLQAPQGSSNLTLVLAVQVNRAGWRCGNALYFYSERARLVSQPGHRLYWGLPPFFPVPPGKCRVSTSSKQLPLSSKSFPINQSPTIVPFDAI